MQKGYPLNASTFSSTLTGCQTAVHGIAAVPVAKIAHMASSNKEPKDFIYCFHIFHPLLALRFFKERQNYGNTKQNIMQIF